MNMVLGLMILLVLGSVEAVIIYDLLGALALLKEKRWTKILALTGILVTWLILGMDYDNYIASIIEVCVTLVLFLVIHKVFGRMIQWAKTQISRKIWMMLSLIALTTIGMVVMSMEVVSYRTTQLENMLVIGLMMLCLISILSVFFIIEQIAKGSQAMLQKQQLEWEMAYYNDLQDKQDETRKFLHDMKNHVGVVQGMLYADRVDTAKSYLGQLTGHLGTKSMKVYCQHHVANAILSNKVKKMEELGISYEILCDLPEHLKISEVEIGSILANTIDNAIEANMQIASLEKRRIEIRSRIQGDQWIYEVINPKVHQIKRTQKRFFSTKEDPANHGYGLRQVQDIVKQYDGLLEVTCDGDTFEILMMICMV
ncbi:MAG: sensor histidine kinase [Cellulosilyticaceae bacterium]